jgi:ankyrin repeat protein
MLPLRWLVTFREGTEMNVGKAAALLEAARTGDEARMRSMLPPEGIAEENGPPDEADGMTPLMAAAAGGHEAVVELLLERGADPARRDGQGRAAAAHARAAGHLDLADRLDTVVDQEKTMR